VQNQGDAAVSTPRCGAARSRHAAGASRWLSWSGGLTHGSDFVLRFANQGVESRLERQYTDRYSIQLEDSFPVRCFIKVFQEF
jgi:hypothetical protein